MKLAPIFACVAWFGAASAVSASPIEAVSLEPIRHQNAAIVIVRPDGTEARYTPAELEEFATYRLRTSTPWREKPAAFDGILLVDLLAANGLAEAEAILVTAENDFTATIPSEVWRSVDMLVATRVDGKAHSRRARGPIQFVVDMTDYEGPLNKREEHLVWMAARIEGVE